MYKLFIRQKINYLNKSMLEKNRLGERLFTKNLTNVCSDMYTKRMNSSIFSERVRSR